MDYPGTKEWYQGIRERKGKEPGYAGGWAGYWVGVRGSIEMEGVQCGCKVRAWHLQKWRDLRDQP